MLVSGFNTISALINYRQANKEYTELQKYVTPSTTAQSAAESQTAQSGAATASDHNDDNADTAQTDGTEAEVQTGPQHPEIPAMDVDFDSLLEINEDFKGWLIIPALDLSYPILQGTDNEEYLHETFEHKRNKAGAIFLDSFNYPDFKDLNTFIYGHSMHDGSMFGTLKTLGEQPELIDEEPYIYVYTPRASYQFQIVAYYITWKGSDTYKFILNPKDYDAYTSYFGEANEYENAPKVDYSEYPKLMTLSTCKGAAGTSTRFVVHSVLTNVRKNTSD
jgi:sortase B